MQKEALLDLLKDAVEIALDQSERLRTDAAFHNAWNNQRLRIESEVEKLNSCDTNWINDAYGQWVRAKYGDRIPNIWGDK